ncbi:MAG: DUF364 domain-containing protein [Deltaproteobacteria bacterium]|nr:DUF364 domain-containing protein [Deltaproteobacteria bacterium]
MPHIVKVLAEHSYAGADEPVRDVRIGLGYTAVQVESGAVGLAYTFRDDLPGGCTAFRGARPLAGRKAADILPYLDSTDKLEASVGLATVNALVSRDVVHAFKGDVLDALDLRSSDLVGMVGFFDPLVKPLRDRVRELRIFELAPRAEGLFGSEVAGEWLPRCDVALITSTTLLNATLDDLLAACRGCRQVALLGPSTPLVPGAFTGTPVTHLSGVLVADPEGVLRAVSEGGGMPSFRGLVRKVVVPVRSTR